MPVPNVVQIAAFAAMAGCAIGYILGMLIERITWLRKNQRAAAPAPSEPREDRQP